MDDLGTEVRHLHGFAIRHGRYRKRLAYFSRIGRQDTIHIGPDLDLPCLGGCAGNRGRIIGAASAERGSFITRRRCNKAGHDDHLLTVLLQPLTDLSVRRSKVHTCVTELFVRSDNFPCVEKTSGSPFRTQVRCDDTGRQEFSVSADEIERAIRQFSNQEDPVQCIVQSGKVSLQLISQISILSQTK